MKKLLVILLLSMCFASGTFGNVNLDSLLRVLDKRILNNVINISQRTYLYKEIFFTQHHNLTHLADMNFFLF